MPVTLIDPQGQRLLGNWRRTIGTAANAHLFGDGWRLLEGPGGRRPLCGKRIFHRNTARAPRTATPCYDCLVEGIRRSRQKGGKT